MRWVCLSALVLGAAGSIATPATASYDPVGGGATKIVLDHGFLAALGKEGVRLRAVAPARRVGATITFPVAGGKIDPITGNGTVDHEGALVLSAGARSIPIRKLQLKTSSKRAPLSAKVGGSQLKLASGARLTVGRSGFGIRVAADDLTLAAKVRTRLVKKLRLSSEFRDGLALGRALGGFQPATVSILRRGQATLGLTPDFLAELESLHVAVNPIFPAERRGSAFTFPLEGGDLSPNAGTGRLDLGGSIEFLQLGGGQVFWHEPALEMESAAFSAETDAEPAPPYPGKTGRTQLGGLTLLEPGTPLPARRTISVGGASMSMGSGTAATFNEVFAEPQRRGSVFEAGEAVGAISLLAQGQ